MLYLPSLPDGPPPLDQRIDASESQLRRAHTVLSDLSLGLESLPLVLSQDGEVLDHLGEISAEGAASMAEQTVRVWREGATRHAREFIRFAEEVYDSTPERANYVLYSMHIAGALTLSIGWRMTLSLTQIRAETVDASQELRRIFDQENQEGSTDQ